MHRQPDGIKLRQTKSRILAEGTRQVAERFRILVAESGFAYKKETVQITVSIGGTIAKIGDGIESLVKRADRLMYSSKESGRNRISIS